MRVVAVDPGGCMGFAYYDGETHEGGFWCCSYDDPWKGVRFVDSEALPALDAIVVEDYRIGGSRARDANETIEQIGALRWIASKRGVPLVRQGPGEGRAFAGKRWEKLRRMGWYLAGPDHPRSAAGHLLLHLVQVGEIPAGRLLESSAVGEVECL